MKTQLLLCSLLLSFQAFSQTQPQIDLQLTFEADPPMPWVVGQEGEVRLRVTNLSPTQSARAQIGPVEQFGPLDPPYSGPPRDEFQTLISFVQNCPLIGSGLPFGITSFLVGDIPAGESRFCFARLRAVRKRDAPNVSNWVASHFNNQSSDPNPANNTATILYSIAAEARPVPLSGWATSLLIIVLLAFSAVHLRK